MEIRLGVLVCGMSMAACGNGVVGSEGATGGSSGSASQASSGSTGALGAAGGTAGGRSSGVAANPCVPGMVSVGDSPMERLTQAQYANSVRQLLALANVSTDNIPSDSVIGTFASNVTTFLTDLDVQQYQSSAEAVAQAALAQANWDSLVPCDHASLGDAACATQFVQTFGQRAYRRALTATEVGRYATLYQTFASSTGPSSTSAGSSLPTGGAAATSGYNNGIRVVVQTMLQSPNFLYRPEIGATNETAGNAIPLTAFELASRLSFFLWNSAPDDTLLSTATAGTLTSPATLQAQAQRLLADPRARQSIASFHTQWLSVTTAASVTKDPSTYPSFSPTVAAAMAQETTDFANYVVLQGDGKLQTLLTAPFTIAGDALLGFYGVSRPSGASASDPLPLDPTQRAGILTQMAFLAVHAHPNESGPVQRGKYIRQNVICEPVPDPPANVNTTPPNPSPNATTRQQLVVHESVPSCAACHTLIDDLGFGFENFDGIGQFRTTEGTQPVDASGAFVALEDLHGAFNGPIELANKLAGSNEVHQCVTYQWLNYALGRAQTSDDACSQSRLVASFNASGQNIKQLLVDIVTADSFRYRNASTGGAP